MAHIFGGHERSAARPAARSRRRYEARPCHRGLRAVLLRPLKRDFKSTGIPLRNVGLGCWSGSLKAPESPETMHHQISLPVVSQHQRRPMSHQEPPCIAVRPQTNAAVSLSHGNNIPRFGTGPAPVRRIGSCTILTDRRAGCDLLCPGGFSPPHPDFWDKSCHLHAP